MKKLFVNVFVIIYAFSLITIFLPSVIPDKITVAECNQIQTKKRIENKK